MLYGLLRIYVVFDYYFDNIMLYYNQSVNDMNSLFQHNCHGSDVYCTRRKVALYVPCDVSCL